MDGLPRLIGPIDLFVVAVSKALYMIYAGGPDEDQGKIDGPGTRGNGSGGREDQGNPRTSGQTLQILYLYL